MLNPPPDLLAALAGTTRPPQLTSPPPTVTEVAAKLDAVIDEPPVNILADQLEALDLGLRIQVALVPAGSIFIESANRVAAAKYYPDGRVQFSWVTHAPTRDVMEATSAILAAVRHCIVHG